MPSDGHNHQRDSWTLRLGSRRLELGPAPVLMGVLNVTPDSFSDGGKYLDAERAVERGLELAAEGAAIIDIGGESTRPGAAELPAEQEIARVVPVISRLKREGGAILSIDTRKSSVARAALEAGADMINDVSALRDPALAPLAAEADCPLVLMHMRGSPATMQVDPRYDDVVAEVRRYLGEALARAAQAGVDAEQTIVDPGIGFGKTVEHNLALIARLDELRTLGRPILIGPSRKSFIGKILGTDVDNRLMGTVAACLYARLRGAALFRVHDVAQVAQALKVLAAVETQQERR